MGVIALVAVMAMGTTAVSAGLGNLDSDLPFLAQNGNGNGNGGRSGENPPNPPGTGNNGQGQGVDHGNPPADPGAGNNSQGNGNGNGNVPQAPEVIVTEEAPETDDAVDGAVDETETEVQAAPVNPAPEKVDVCHVADKETGETVLINISLRAVPAHEGHGDTVVDEDAEVECGEAAEEVGADEGPADTAPDAPSIPGDDDDGDEGDDEDEEEAGTPVASPEATPDADADEDDD